MSMKNSTTEKTALEKLKEASQSQGQQVEVSEKEAEELGAFEESALSEKDALDGCPKEVGEEEKSNQ